MEVRDKREKEQLMGDKRGERGVEPDKEQKHATTTEHEEREHEERGKAQGKGIRV
jgi:hypothetical protein